MDAAQKLCEGGDWQEYGFSLCRRNGVPATTSATAIPVLAAYIDEHHTYEAERGMLSGNIVPVYIATLARDGKTLPPVPLTKRGSGRPRKQRIRKRSRWAHEPEI
jgi:hypothetical protein